ncbi:MAG: ATP-binding protein [Acidaminococcaceae bacterium]|nr:ATP-binding protein [Acidaminococcaceae bacterium]
MKQDFTVKEIIKREKRLRALGQEKLCDCDFAHDNGQSPITTKVMREYANHYEEMLKEGTGLFIYGGPGAGKSYAAAEIVNELTDNGYDCMFTSMNNIMTELNTMGLEGRRNLFSQIFSKDLLVLDDLGSEVETPFCNQTFIQIVNTCLSKCIPIVITTPYSEEALIKDGGNEKRVMAITRLLKRNINYTVMMPMERRNHNVQRKQKAEALVKGAADQQTLPAFAVPSEWEETTVQECLPEIVQQTLSLNENSEKEK